MCEYRTFCRKDTFLPWAKNIFNWILFLLIILIIFPDSFFHRASIRTNLGKMWKNHPKFKRKKSFSTQFRVINDVIVPESLSEMKIITTLHWWKQNKLQKMIWKKKNWSLYFHFTRIWTRMCEWQKHTQIHSCSHSHATFHLSFHSVLDYSMWKICMETGSWSIKRILQSFPPNVGNGNFEIAMEKLVRRNWDWVLLKFADFPMDSLIQDNNYYFIIWYISG